MTWTAVRKDTSMPRCVSVNLSGAAASQNAMRSAVQRGMTNYPTRDSGRRAVPNREAIYKGGPLAGCSKARMNCAGASHIMRDNSTKTEDDDDFGVTSPLADLFTSLARD